MRLRLATPQDGPQVADIYAPIVRDTAISFEIIPPTPAEMAARIEAALRTHVWLVADDGGAVAGYAYAGKHRERTAYGWSTDTTIYMRDSAKGRGLGGQLYRALLRILAAQNYRVAFAGIALPNTASVALHESVGFSHLGTYPTVGYKLDRWHDVGWWCRRLSDESGGAEPLIPLSEVGGIAQLLDD